MGDSSRRGFLAALIAVGVGGLIKLGDEIVQVASRGRRAAPAADDVAESIPNNTQSPPEEPTETSTSNGLDALDDETIQVSNCTDAYIEGFEWRSTDGISEVFHAKVVNQSDIAGSVEVTLELYPTELELDLLESFSKTVAVGGQDVRTVEIQAIPPADAEYAVMRVSSQDCR